LKTAGIEDIIDDDKTGALMVYMKRTKRGQYTAGEPALFEESTRWLSLLLNYFQG
jgi:hypothetical protein